MTTDVKVTNKKRKIASLDRRKARAGWIFVLPFVLGFILIYLPMVVDSIKYSFYNIEVLRGGGFEIIPVGWTHYRNALLDDPDFAQILVTGLLDMIFDIPMILIFSLFMAVLLNQKMVGRAAFRAIFFIPVILSTGLMESIEAQNIMGDYMDSAEGIDDGSGSSAASDLVSAMDIEALFSGMAVGQGLVEYVVVAINRIYDIVNRSGVQMLIFLAGLQSISPAIYESVQIDGASAWETFWKITFPMISPMILVNAVYTVIDSFTAENAVMTYINSIATEIPNMGSAISAAMSWIYFLMVIAILGVLVAVLSAYTFYQRKK